MPNPKVGTVSPDVAGAVKNAKSGQVRYRADKAGVVHCTIGKATFEANKLKENLSALLADLQKAKPASSKGIYLKKISVSSTMGPGVPALGVREGVQVTQSQVAATIARLVGEDFVAASPKSAPPLPDLGADGPAR